MKATLFTESSERLTVVGIGIFGYFSGILLAQFLFFCPPAFAQDFVPEKFNKSLIEESLQDQEALREEMLLDQAILREEMEQIRLEIQRIMKEIALAMKEEALKLKAELQGLQGETQRIQQEIMAALQKSKEDFAEGQEEMRKELQKMRKEAKSLNKEIKEVLTEQKAIWRQETAALKETLVDAREEMNLARVDSDKALQSSRSAVSDFKKDNEITMADSRNKSNAAMFDAGNTFKKSQQDYKKDSVNITRELMEELKNTRENLKRRQKFQRQGSIASQKEVLAALKSAKKQRVAELKQDLHKKKLQKKKDARSKHKADQKRKRIKKVKKKQALLKESRTERKQKVQKRKADYRKASKKSKIKLQKKRLKRKSVVQKVKKQLKKKPELKRSRPADKEAPVLQDSQDIRDKSPDALDKSFDEGFGKTEKVKKKPQQQVPEKDESELVMVADAPVEAAKETPEEIASRFSKNITSLKNDLKKKSGNPGAILEKLGDAYLEAQRFLGSQKNDEDRQKILDQSENQDLLLGSYEQAAWAYKLSLGFNHKTAETHYKIGKIYNEMGDGRNALMHARLAHQLLKSRDNSKQMEEEVMAFIEKLMLKYKSKSEKNSA